MGVYGGGKTCSSLVSAELLTQMPGKPLYKGLPNG